MTAASMPLRVVIVDDHPLTAEGLRARFDAAGLDVVACVAAAEFTPFDLVPDVVVCDLRLPGRSGAEAVSFVVARGLPVLAMSGVASAEEVLEAVAAGASGFLAKTAAGHLFVAATRTVALGGRFLTAEAAHVLRLDAERRSLTAGDLSRNAVGLLRAVERGDTTEEAASALGLDASSVQRLLSEIWELGKRRRRLFAPTARELEVLRLSVTGLTHKELAERLNVSVRTVPDFLSSIKTKYLAGHPTVDPAIAPLALARRWAAELGLS